MTFQATITIEPQQVIGAVHPHLYGANLEHIGQSIYGGVWAEMLKSRKFAGQDRMFISLSEGLQHQNPNFGIVEPWTAVNPDYHGVLFVHDNTTFYTGSQSQRITIRQPDGLPHGIQQNGLYLEASRAYEVRIVLLGENQRVRVELGNAVWHIPAVAPEWTTYTTTLTPTISDVNGTFSITIEQGNLWIGCVSLMPADHANGFRADVIAALQEWTPTFLRWAGGNFASAYHWQMGIGDRDKRPSYLDPAWNAWEPNDVGTDEFIALCRLVGSEPMLTINMGNGTVEEAVAWVAYCQEMGYGVKTWFVGNEQFGNWQIGHVDAETYARRYLEFARAMRQVDPALNLIAVGVPTDLYGHWNELVLQIAGAEIDELSVHYYSIRTEKWDTPPADLYLPKIASAHEVALMLDHTLDIIAPIPLAFDEWNTYVGGKPPDFFEDYTIADALYTGALMNACLQRADRIKMSAIFNLINVMGNYRVTPQKIWKTPSSLVLELMTHHRGDQAVRCWVECPHISTPAAGNLPAFEAVPLIDASATSGNGKLYLSIVNCHIDQAAEITLTGINVTGQVELYQVIGDDPMALNTEATPQRVKIESSKWTAGDPLILPAHSFTMMVMNL